MGRVEIAEAVQNTAGQAIAGATVQVNIRGGGAATLYAAETGSTTVGNPRTTDAAGRVEAWVDEGSYDLVVSRSGYTSYTQPIEAASGSAAANYAVTKEAPINVNYPEHASAGAGRIQAAINAAAASVAGQGEVYIPAGQYDLTSTPLSLPVGVTYRGDGKYATVIRSALGDVTRPVAGCAGLKMEGLTLYSLSGGGHCIAPQGNFSRSEFRDVRMIQTNAAKSIWRQVNLGVYIDVLWDHFEMNHVSTATVPGVHLVHTTDGDINSNTWQRGVCEYSGEYFFHLESGNAGGFLYNNIFRDLTMEHTTGGNIKILSGQANVIENVNTYDLATVGVTTRDLIYIGKSATGQISKNNLISHANRITGSLGAGLKDIKLVAAQSQRTRIESCGAAIMSGYTVDLGSTDYNVLIGLVGATVQNVSTTTTIRIEEGVVISPEFHAYSHYLLPQTITAASAPANSLFRDSADNIIKIKDNGGTVRTLY